MEIGHRHGVARQMQILSSLALTKHFKLPVHLKGGGLEWLLFRFN